MSACCANGKIGVSIVKIKDKNHSQEFLYIL